MAFAHFALRPALAETLEPPQRLKLLGAILQRFFAAVTSAIVLIMVSGGYLMAKIGSAVPVPVHVMLVIGVVMMLIFAYLRLRTYPKLRAAIADSRWPDAGGAASTVRHLVAVNLGLGVVVVIAAVLGR